MEAKELMLGDLIYPDNIDVSIVARVVHIGEREIGFLAPNSGVIWWNQPENVRPIPITPEILEKNGFRETDMVVVGTRKMRWESEDGRTEITIWMDDTMPMEIRKNIYYEDEVCYTLPFAWAVHELQHALRLCGIDKEVVL